MAQSKAFGNVVKLRDVVTVKDPAFGAKGDGATDDTTAIANAIASARAASRRTIYAPSGTYLISATLDLADVSLIGDGMVATVFRQKSGANLSAPLFRVSEGGQAIYANFAIDGNKANNSDNVNQHGIQVRGSALWTLWQNVKVFDVHGNGLLLSTFNAGRPNQHTFINFRVSAAQRIGVRLNAGRGLHFINLNVEDCGLLASGQAAIALTGTDEACQRVIFDGPWVERVGTATAAGDVFEIAAGSGIKIRNALAQDYGLSAGGGGHGINISGSASDIEIDTADCSGRAASQAGQRKIIIAAGATRVLLKNMSLSSADLEDNSTARAQRVNINGLIGTPGTWTPTIFGSVTPGAQTYSQQSGTYTIVGNRCFFDINLVLSAKDATTSGSLRVSLPFTAVNETDYRASVQSGDWRFDLDAAGGYTSVGGIISSNTNYIALLENGDNVGSANLTDADMSASSSIRMSGCYRLS